LALAGFSDNATAQTVDNGLPLSLQLFPFLAPNTDSDASGPAMEDAPAQGGNNNEPGVEAEPAEPAEPANEEEAPVENAADQELPPAPPRNARGSIFAGALDIARQALEPSAPSLIFRPRIGIEEVATDNVAGTARNHQSDLISRIIPGIDISADTLRLQAIFDYTASLDRAVNYRPDNRFTQRGYTTAQAIVFPNLLFVDLHGVIHEIDRQGLGPPNPSLVTSSHQTQTYSLSVSPDLKSRVGDFGIFDLRYVYGQLWVDKNTEATPTLGPLGGAMQQQARADLRMPGTLMNRLLIDLNLTGSTYQINKFPGTFRRASGEVINEYHITRSISAVAAGGYETLSDRPFPRLNGEGGIWDLGARWRPNADSSILILYGSHDLKTGISGEIQWRLTPVTAFFASHVESINSTQQSLIVNNLNALLNSEGPAVGTTFDQNPTIALLNNRGVGLFRQVQDIDLGSGLPLEEVNNFQPAANGFFRLKQTRAALYHAVANQSVFLAAFHLERSSLISKTEPLLKTDGIVLGWSPIINDSLLGRADIAYRQQEKSDFGLTLSRYWAVNAGASLEYQASPSLGLALRYDYIRRAEAATAVINAITLRLEKHF